MESTGDLCPGRGNATAVETADADTTSRGPDQVHGFLMPQAGTTRAADREQRAAALPIFGPSGTNRTGHDNDRGHGRTKDDSDPGSGAAAAAPRRPAAGRRAAGAAHGACHEAVRGGSQEEVGRRRQRGDAVDPPRRDLRDPRRERIRQEHAHPAGQHAADAGRRPSRGVRQRRRARRDGGQAAHQPGERRRRLLQEAVPAREPRLRGAALRPGREEGACGGDPDHGVGSASARSG